MSNAPTQCPGAVTSQYDFFNTTSDGDKLFSVRGGIPLRDAFNQLSLLIAQSQSVVDDVCTSVSAEEVPQSQGAASHLLEFTYALAQAMHGGLIEHEKFMSKP